LSVKYLDLLLQNVDSTIDPSDPTQRQIVISLFKEILLAEKEARDWFAKSDDPAVVQHSDYFEKNRAYLVEEEERHVQLFADALKKLGAEDTEVSPESMQFWRATNSTEFKRQLPLTPAQMALIATISEGLGLVFIANLEKVMKDSPARQVLHYVLEDEGGHLSVAEQIIQEELKDPSTNKKLLMTLNTYIRYSKAPLKAQKKVVESAGFDFYALGVKMIGTNLDRLEELGMNLGFKWGTMRRFLAKVGLLKSFMVIYMSI
jgi:rubrerythrin